MIARFYFLLWSALLVLAPLSAWAGDFETAGQDYDQGRFGEAKSSYEKLLENGATSANVYYDLGNVDFRLGSPGRAILNYERALALQPQHPEAQANLKLLREQNASRLLPVPWDARLARILSTEIWSILAAVSAWVVLFTFVLIFRHRQGDHFGLWMTILACLVVGVAASLALRDVVREQTLAVITAKQTEARLAPAESAGVAEALTAGSQVRILSERGEWIYCELPGSGRGWIPEGAVERVRPARS